MSILSSRLGMMSLTSSRAAQVMWSSISSPSHSLGSSSFMYSFVGTVAFPVMFNLV